MKWELSAGHAEAALDTLSILDGVRDGTSSLNSQQRQKAYWRRGEALIGLKRPEQAVDNFVRVYAMEEDAGQKQAYRGKVEAVVRMLARMPERLGVLMRNLVQNVIDGYLEKEEATCGMRVVEEVDELTMNEAAYLVVKEMEADGSRDALESAYETCCRWLLNSSISRDKSSAMTGVNEALGLEEALVWRSRVCCRGKAYEQAREDAMAALRLLEMNHDGRDTSTLVYRRLVVSGYVALGRALNAEMGYTGRDGPRALKALRKAVMCIETGTCGSNVMGNVQGLYDLVQEVTEGLTKEEVDAVERDLGAAGTVLDRVGRRISGNAGGKNVECMKDEGGREMVHFTVDTSTCTFSTAAAEHGTPLEMTLAFATTSMLTPFGREQLRKCVASCTQVEIGQVSIEGVRMHEDELVARLIVQTRTGACVDALRERLVGTFAASPRPGVDSMDSMNLVDLGRLRDELGDCVRVDVAKVETATRDLRAIELTDPVNAVTKAKKPEMQLALPYRDYKLVDAVGRPVERGQKHAFCMSRVYYDRSEMESTETWVELADGSCRWRQSASEIKIIALRVPPDVSLKLVEVQFHPYELRVTNKLSGEAYLAGRLHRGIVPNDCFWTHLGGEGEDGFLISMTKMNLEVLQKHWMHSEMWWSKLFVDHPECQWDDYSKDYSDLPEEVMERHRIKEAQREETRALESKDEKRRKRLTGEEERRKRARMNRLSKLREGAC